LYRDVTFYNKDKVTSFANALERNPELGTLVRSLDFQPVQARTSIRDLRKCLSLTTNLKSLYIRLNDLSTDHLLRTVFFETLSLETLEITGKLSDSIDAADSVMAVFFSKQDSEYVCNVTNLTFRAETPASTFILWNLLPRCPKLRKLDVRHTAVDMEALRSIPETVRLVHLDISHCECLVGSELAQFLTSHPVVKDSLISLHCEIDDYSEERGEAAELAEEDIHRILEELPVTVRSLHLGGSVMSKAHLSSLRNLCEQGQLEELGIGAGLMMRDIEGVILGSRHEFDEVEEDDESSLGSFSDPKDECSAVLDPMRQAVAITKLRERLASISPSQTALIKKKSGLRYLDISRMRMDETSKILRSVLLGAESIPLETIIIDDSAFDLTDFKELMKTCASVGWTARGIRKSRWIQRTEK
jgi:hypothetical protein